MLTALAFCFFAIFASDDPTTTESPGENTKPPAIMKQILSTLITDDNDYFRSFTSDGNKLYGLMTIRDHRCDASDTHKQLKLFSYDMEANQVLIAKFIQVGACDGYSGGDQLIWNGGYLYHRAKTELMIFSDVDLSDDQGSVSATDGVSEKCFLGEANAMYCMVSNGVEKWDLSYPTNPVLTPVSMTFPQYGTDSWVEGYHYPGNCAYLSGKLFCGGNQNKFMTTFDTASGEMAVIDPSPTLGAVPNHFFLMGASGDVVFFMAQMGSNDCSCGGATVVEYDTNTEQFDHHDVSGRSYDETFRVGHVYGDVVYMASDRYLIQWDTAANEEVYSLETSTSTSTNLFYIWDDTIYLAAMMDAYQLPAEQESFVGLPKKIPAPGATNDQSDDSYYENSSNLLTINLMILTVFLFSV